MAVEKRKLSPLQMTSRITLAAAELAGTMIETLILGKFDVCHVPLMN